LGRASLEVPDAENGEVDPVDNESPLGWRLLVAPSPRPESAELLLSTGLCGLPRLRADNVVGLAIDLATSGLMVVSRANNGVTSRDELLETPVKTRSISVEVLAMVGDLVVSAPLITTPV
jgi:hypothetical protein